MDNTALTKKIKSYDELTIQDNFMFQKVMRNKRICRRVIETLLDIDVKDIGYPEAEKTIATSAGSKSVRLDVYVNDDKGTIFNIEMQTENDKRELPKRARYYQASIDIDLLEKGADYEELNKTFIIFICTFGLFDGKKHKYTFKNICDEDKNIELEDETCKVFLSTKGKEDDIPSELKKFLDYIDGKQVNDEFIKTLEDEVTYVKEHKEWRREYMTLEMEMRRRGKAEREEGRLEGKLEMCKKMLAKGKVTIEELLADYDLTKDEIAALQT